MGQFAIPLIISAVSSGAQFLNQRAAQRKQDRILARGVERQQALDREAQARLNQQLGELERSGPEAERRQAQERFMQQLQRTRGAAASGLPTVPGASNRYTADVEAAESGSAAEAADLAGIMSRIDAPTLQRLGETAATGRTGAALREIGDRSRGDQFVTELRARSVQPNPWVSLASKAGQAYSMWLAGQPGAAGTGAEAVAGNDALWDNLFRTAARRKP